MLACGTKSFTWLILRGVFFTVHQTEHNHAELANTIWREGMLIHSFDENIMLPCYALTDGELLQLPSDLFNAAVEKDADLSFALAQHYHDQFKSTLENYRRNTLDPSDVRISDLEARFAAIPELENEHISDSVIAMFTGLHRVSVNRLRNKSKSK